MREPDSGRRSSPLSEPLSPAPGPRPLEVSERHNPVGSGSPPAQRGSAQKVWGHGKRLHLPCSSTFRHRSRPHPKNRHPRRHAGRRWSCGPGSVSRLPTRGYKRGVPPSPPTQNKKPEDRRQALGSPAQGGARFLPRQPGSEEARTPGFQFPRRSEEARCFNLSGQKALWGSS